jgi:hypothetical protein
VKAMLVARMLVNTYFLCFVGGFVFCVVHVPREGSSRFMGAAQLSAGESRFTYYCVSGLWRVNARVARVKQHAESNSASG